MHHTRGVTAGHPARRYPSVLERTVGDAPWVFCKQTAWAEWKSLLCFWAVLYGGCPCCVLVLLCALVFGWGSKKCVGVSLPGTLRQVYETAGSVVAHRPLRLPLCYRLPVLPVTYCTSPLFVGRQADFPDCGRFEGAS